MLFKQIPLVQITKIILRVKEKRTKKLSNNLYHDEENKELMRLKTLNKSQIGLGNSFKCLRPYDTTNEIYFNFRLNQDLQVIYSPWVSFPRKVMRVCLQQRIHHMCLINLRKKMKQ